MQATGLGLTADGAHTVAGRRWLVVVRSPMVTGHHAGIDEFEAVEEAGDPVRAAQVVGHRPAPVVLPDGLDPHIDFPAVLEAPQGMDKTQPLPEPFQP